MRLNSAGEVTDVMPALNELTLGNLGDLLFGGPIDDAPLAGRPGSWRAASLFLIRRRILEVRAVSTRCAATI